MLYCYQILRYSRVGEDKANMDKIEKLTKLDKLNKMDNMRSWKSSSHTDMIELRGNDWI